MYRSPDSEALRADIQRKDRVSHYTCIKLNSKNYELCQAKNSHERNTLWIIQDKHMKATIYG